MLCRAVLCCAVLCCAVLCCAVPCSEVLCCAVLCRALLSCTVLCCDVLCCPVLSSAVLRCAVLCCALPQEERRLRLQQWQQLRYILRLQRAFRIRLSKKCTGERNVMRRMDMQREYEDSNAGIIQRAWLCLQARRRLDELRSQRCRAEGERVATKLDAALTKMLDSKQ